MKLYRKLIKKYLKVLVWVEDLCFYYFTHLFTLFILKDVNFKRTGLGCKGGSYDT